MLRSFKPTRQTNRLVLGASGGLLILGLLTGGASFGILAPRLTKSSVVPKEVAPDDLESKIAKLSQPAAPSRKAPDSVTISENEANSYLRQKGKLFLPPAVHDPVIHIKPDQITGTADVDFNELEQFATQSDDWGAKLVALVFRGKQRVVAAGKLVSAEGRGTLTLTSLTVGDTAIPAGFVNFVAQNYMERRYGIDLSKPFSLPPNVSRIELANGEAIFHRGTQTRR